MFIREIDTKEKINPYTIPGLLNDFKFKIKSVDNFLLLKHIMRHVSDQMNIPEIGMISAIRSRPIVLARQTFCYLAKKYTRCSLREIGECIGGRDHTTVIHSIKTLNDVMDSDPDLRFHVDGIEKLLYEKSGRELKYEIVGGKHRPLLICN